MPQIFKDSGFVLCSVGLTSSFLQGQETLRLYWRNSVQPVSCGSVLLTQSPSLWTLLVTKSGGFFPHQAILHCTSWVSYNLILFWHCLPRASVLSHRWWLSPTRLLSPHWRCQFQVLDPRLRTAAVQLSYKLKVPTTPSSIWINWLEWLTECSKTRLPVY